jgi:hypothetical protein
MTSLSSPVYCLWVKPEPYPMKDASLGSAQALLTNIRPVTDACQGCTLQLVMKICKLRTEQVL